MQNRSEMVTRVRELQARLLLLKSALALDKVEKRLGELAIKTSAANFWNDPKAAQPLLKEQDRLTKLRDEFGRAEKSGEETNDFLQLIPSDDDPMLNDLATQMADLEKAVRKLELTRMFQDESDPSNAILSINSGAGGTEAQDWAEMLLRMYLRWCDRNAMQASVVDTLPGEGAGIKNATVTVAGSYAYGYLKAESGIHRLVRISPFDANARRHTSFASVFVIPEVSDDIKIDIKESDLRIDTYRASGAGGQHVNKTDSAVRITHHPSGIVVQCQNERSQHKNKAMCMKILQSKLYDREREEREKKLDSFHKTKKEIAWGSQIRSYTMQPYQLVKDHRTKVENGNIAAVLDGDITPFIEAYLLNPNAKGTSASDDE